MPGRNGVVLLLSLFTISHAPAQSSGSDAVGLRRTAVYSALASRASREGVALNVGLCSVVQAIEVSSAVRSAAPTSIAASLVGSGSATCSARGGAQSDGPGVAFGEVVSAIVSDSRGGGLQSVTVLLRVWEGPGVYMDEVYEFVANRDTLWTPVRFEQARAHINLVASPNPNILMILNGQILHATTSLEILNRVRGQLVDSIRVFGANDSSYTTVLGSKAMMGGVIIGTHPLGRRP